MPATDATVKRAAALLDDLHHVCDRLKRAQASASRIENDFHEPAERAAVTLLTTDGHVARHWADLCNDLTVAVEILGDDIMALDEALVATTAPAAPNG